MHIDNYNIVGTISELDHNKSTLVSHVNTHCRSLPDIPIENNSNSGFPRPMSKKYRFLHMKDYFIHTSIDICTPRQQFVYRKILNEINEWRLKILTCRNIIQESGTKKEIENTEVYN